MGRLPRYGLEYFSVDTSWESEVRLIKAKYGALEGVGFLTELWASIYRENYYRKWDDETELLFADEIKKPVEWVREVIEYCFSKNILDRSIFEAKGVLTGHGIQKRYFKIAQSLHREYIEYLEGITYPTYMPKNSLGGNHDNLGGNDDKVGGNTDNLGGYADKARKGKEREYKAQQQPAAAPVDNFPSPEEADLYAFCLERAKRKRGIKDLDAYARSLMDQSDVRQEF